MAIISFRSLLTADSSRLARILSDPRVLRHMPLADSTVDADWVENWKAAKVTQWPTAALGPWAVYVDDQLAGWGGLQPEDHSSDAGLAMVLAPEYWGYGVEAMQLAISKFRSIVTEAEVTVSRILVEFPETRHAERALAKFGFVPIDSVDIGGVMFNRYALSLID